MNLLADESVDGMVIRRLRTDGHDVVAVGEVSPSIPDTVVLRQAADTGRVLITADKDFGELVYRLGQAHAGVVLLRLAGLTSGERAALVSGVFLEQAGIFPGAFAVVEPETVRVRRPSVMTSDD